MLERFAQTGIDGVTIARGAVGNPWIFSQTRALYEGRQKPTEPSISEQAEIISSHFEEVMKLHGKRKGVGYFRKFSCRYADCILRKSMFTRTCLQPKVLMPFVMLSNTGTIKIWQNESGKIALYIHIPFCTSKCRYCGFYSVPVSEKDVPELITCNTERA